MVHLTWTCTAPGAYDTERSAPRQGSAHRWLEQRLERELCRVLHRFHDKPGAHIGEVRLDELLIQRIVAWHVGDDCFQQVVDLPPECDAPRRALTGLLLHDRSEIVETRAALCWLVLMVTKTVNPKPSLLCDSRATVRSMTPSTSASRAMRAAARPSYATGRSRAARSAIGSALSRCNARRILRSSASMTLYLRHYLGYRAIFCSI